MDVQDVLRWLVEAKIPVAKAMPLVSSLAAAGVKSSDGISSLEDAALARAVKEKPLLKKIRAKISDVGNKGSKRSAGHIKSEGDREATGGGGSKRARQATSSSLAQKLLAAASIRVPAPVECSTADAELAEIEEVAQRLSFDWSESVTLGRAIADWLALRKGEYLGILEADEEAERVAREATDDLPTRTVEILGQDITVRKTEGGWRAISKGRLVPAKRVHTYLRNAFGDKLGPVRAALKSLAAAIPYHQVESTVRAMILYESFRPEVPRGKAGWGQSGMLRLARVLELRDEVTLETRPKIGAIEVKPKVEATELKPKVEAIETKPKVESLGR